MEKDLEVFSEKLGRTIIISDNPDIDEKEIIFDDTDSSM